MIFGYFLLYLALAATVGANVLWVLAQDTRHADRAARFTAGAKTAVFTATAGVVGAALYLMTLIGTHQFQVAYVAAYSAKRSAPGYLYAAFWGGQEGSLLLWAFWTAILGLVLAYTARAKAARVWPIFGVVQVFLIGLILVKCPFALGTGPVPTDGRGLNPLLENPWMVIHPPILFLGFAATLLPWVWTMYGLLHRDWNGWIKAALPWTLFAFATLGFGLSLGGYWAYETLGWGGFWGWDPVENSSLVPWLLLTALLHGLPIQKARGGFAVTNLLLGSLPFAAMFYGTFLTRSGLLSDFSVHSFSSLGEDGFYILLGGVLASFFVPLALLLWRAKSIPKPAAYEKIASREFGYFVGAAVMGLLGLLVAVGMSAPLITKIPLVAQLLHTDPAKGASAQPEFYNTASYPLALILALGMAATPYLAWRATGDTMRSLKRLLPAYGAAVVLTMAMTGAAMAQGIRAPLMLLLFAVSVFAVMANLILLVPRLPKRQSRQTVGGFVAHMGAGMLLMGVAVLVAFGQTRDGEEGSILLIKNRPREVLGFKLTYLGMTTQPFDRDNNALRIRVARGNDTWEANPRFYYAPWENKDTQFANPPAIHRSGWGDLYIAYNGGPGGDTTIPHPNQGFALKSRETKKIGDYTFTFLGLNLDDRAKAALVSHDTRAMQALPEVFFKAAVAVQYQGLTTFAEPQMKLDQKTGGMYSVPVEIPGGEGRAKTMLMFVPPPAETMNSPRAFDQIQLQTLGAPDPTEAVYVSVSTKPLIWLVWLGSLLYTGGGLVAYRRRAKEAGLVDD